MGFDDLQDVSADGPTANESHEKEPYAGTEEQHDGEGSVADHAGVERCSVKERVRAEDGEDPRRQASSRHEALRKIVMRWGEHEQTERRGRNENKEGRVACEEHGPRENRSELPASAYQEKTSRFTTNSGL